MTAQPSSPHRPALALLLTLALLTGPATAQERVPGERWLRFRDVAQAGFDPQRLEAAHQAWQQLPSAAFLIVADGAVVAAWGDVERRYMCHSVRKSFLSALFGVAWDAGQVELNLTLAELGIDDEPDPLLPIEKQARILDLLKARSGVYHPAAYAGRTDSAPRGSVGPGQAFAYNNWDFNTLATIYRQLTGEDVFEAFDRHLGDPLAMQDWRVRDGYDHYERDKSSHPAYPFRLSARDAARFGLLFAREGRWAGEQLLSHHWVTRSTALYSFDEPVQAGEPVRFGYGMMWWVLLDPPMQEARMVAALGVGNQMIATSPRDDLVIVNRADTYQGERTPTGPLLELIEQVLAARTGEPVADPDLEPLPAQPAPAHRTHVDDAALEPFVGDWPFPAPVLGQPPVGRLVFVAEDGHLVGSTPTRGRFGFYLQPDGQLVQEDSHERLFVVRDDAGALQGFADAEALAGGLLVALGSRDDAGLARLQALQAGDESRWSELSRVVLGAVQGERSDLVGRRLNALAERVPRPSLAAVLVQAAGQLAEAGRPQGARAVLEQTVAGLPEALEAWLALADLARIGADPDRARAAYERARDLAPDDPRIHQGLELLGDG